MVDDCFGGGFFVEKRESRFFIVWLLYDLHPHTKLIQFKRDANICDLSDFLPSDGKTYTRKEKTPQTQNLANLTSFFGIFGFLSGLKNEKKPQMLIN